ncbi:hypothetical protein ACVH9Z_21480 [Rhodococcus opacus]|uniref:hypothetical protein n=1 Tax=Rhodococcus opacus TaxID=37919 RepID=UPI0012DB015E|nr:hypothetical protein [Rhodococcus opacus]
MVGEPIEESGQLGEPFEHAPQVQRGPVGARQLPDRLVVRREHSHGLLFGDQPPPAAGDRGEIEAAGRHVHLYRQADHFREVPPIVVEHRTSGSFWEGEACLAADISAGE